MLLAGIELEQPSPRESLRPNRPRLVDRSICHVGPLAREWHLARRLMSAIQIKE